MICLTFVTDSSFKIEKVLFSTNLKTASSCMWACESSPLCPPAWPLSSELMKSLFRRNSRINSSFCRNIAMRSSSRNCASSGSAGPPGLGSPLPPDAVAPLAIPDPAPSSRKNDLELTYALDDYPRIVTNVTKHIRATSNLNVELNNKRPLSKNLLWQRTK